MTILMGVKGALIGEEKAKDKDKEKEKEKEKEKGKLRHAGVEPQTFEIQNTRQ